MPRRLSYADLEAEHRRARSQADVLSTVLNLIINTKPDHVERLRERSLAPPDRSRADYPASYVFALYGATRADGGYAVVTYKAPGQSAWTTAHRLDDLVDYDREHFTMIPDRMLWNVAVGRLCLARSRVLDAERAAAKC